MCGLDLDCPDLEVLCVTPSTDLSSLGLPAFQQEQVLAMAKRSPVHLMLRDNTRARGARRSEGRRPRYRVLDFRVPLTAGASIGRGYGSCADRSIFV